MVILIVGKSYFRKAERFEHLFSYYVGFPFFFSFMYVAVYFYNKFFRLAIKTRNKSDY
jgi:hypothetical protein